MLREDIPDWRFDLIRSSAEELRRQIPTLTDDELVVGMHQLATLGNLGHNTASSLDVREALNGRELARLPLDFWLFPEGLYVIGASPPYEDLIGSRVETIGGVPADEAVRRTASTIDRDPGAFATVIWLTASRLGITGVLKRLGLSDSLAHANLGLVDRRGRQRQVRVTAGGYRQRPKLYHPARVAPAQPPLYLRRVGESFWFTDLPEGPVYFQFNQVTRRIQGGATNEPISEFARKLRQHLAQPGKGTLIVDLRHNNGGDTYIYPELLRTLIAFDTMPGRRLYVIAGRNTYSAAQNFIVDLDRLTDAVIVGEPTSPPNAGGDPVTINLPYSGAMLGASSTVWALQSPQDTRTSITPQLPATLTAAEYFSGSDPALEAILAHIISDEVK